jgi:hypothetical protein
MEQRTAEQQNNEQQNFEGWFRYAQSFYKTDRIPSFDIRYSLFDIRYLSASGGFALIVSFLRRPVVVSANRWADT